MDKRTFFGQIEDNCKKVVQRRKYYLILSSSEAALYAHFFWFAKGSNHLTGCAVDIRCLGPEQMIRYACLLLDTADENGWVFDELIQEKRGTTYWIHFAVRPKDNRRKILFDCR